MVGFDDHGYVSNCYSTGTVIGTHNTGGLVGNEIHDNQIISSFWDTETSGQTTSSGGTGLTTAQMQTVSTFVDSGWDFENDWWINDGRDYPRLAWQPFGDLNNDSVVDVVDLGMMGASWGMDITGQGVDKRCELSGDNLIGINDLSVIIDMWLEGPSFEE